MELADESINSNDFYQNDGTTRMAYMLARRFWKFRFCYWSPTGSTVRMRIHSSGNVGIVEQRLKQLAQPGELYARVY